MTKQKKIKIGDKSYVRDGDSFMEKGAYDRYQKKLKTAPLVCPGRMVVGGRRLRNGKRVKNTLN